jgi:hypothetical protein
VFNEKVLSDEITLCVRTGFKVIKAQGESIGWGISTKQTGHILVIIEARHGFIGILYILLSILASWNFPDGNTIIWNSNKDLDSINYGRSIIKFVMTKQSREIKTYICTYILFIYTYAYR